MAINHEEVLNGENLVYSTKYRISDPRVAEDHELDSQTQAIDEDSGVTLADVGESFITELREYKHETKKLKRIMQNGVSIHADAEHHDEPNTKEVIRRVRERTERRRKAKANIGVTIDSRNCEAEKVG